jgi:hypothetical protein
VQDGARNALIGYLYQFLGVAGLRVLSVLSSDEELFCRGLGDVPNGRLAHEAFGQDAAMQWPDGAIVAFQFKYSWDGTKPLDKGDLHSILDAFDRSQSELSPPTTFTNFVVVTNRQLELAVQGILAAQNEDEPPAGLLPGPQSKLRRNIDERHGKPEASVAAWRSILRRLKFKTNIPIGTWQSVIQSYGESLGVRPEELQPAIYGLIGELITKTTTGPVEVSESLLKRNLVKASDARPLNYSRSGCAHEIARGCIETFMRDSLGVDPPTLIPRRFLTALGEALTTYPIVFVAGRGGCGKSILAAQFLLNRSVSVFCLAQLAGFYKDGWLSQEFNRCRSQAERHLLAPDSDEQVVARLRIANPNVPLPILLIDLDGLDEMPKTERSAVRQLIRLVRMQAEGGPPPVALLLTVRSERYMAEETLLSLIAEWLETEAPERHLQFVGAVDVLPFGPQELTDAAAALDQNAATRIDRTLASMAAGGGPSEREGAVVGDPSPPANRAVVEALFLPAMWGAFAKHTAQQRNAILDGESQALRALALGFVRRFCARANKRRPGVSEDQIMAGLRAVAEASQIGPRVGLREDHWVTPAQRHWNRDEANHFYRDAVSYGLLAEESASGFRWAHGFVRDYLSQGATG